MVSRINHIIYMPKKAIVFFIVLVILATFMRFYNFSDLLYWMFDEERDAFVVKRILVDKHPTLIGGAIPGAFYLAPGYFYISAIFYFFSQGNPLGPAIAASTLGVISTFLIFFTTKQLFNKKTAVFTSLLYAASYLVVGYNRTWWPLTFAPTVAIVTYYCLYKIIKSKDYRWSIVLSIALIVGVQSDPSNFSLIALTVFFWSVYKLSLKNRYVVWSIFLFFFSHLPLVLFDLRHNFFNSRLILDMLTFSNSGGELHFIEALKGLLILPQTFSRLIYVSFSPDFALQIVPDQFYVDQKFGSIPSLLLLFSITVLVWFFFRFLKSKSKKDLGVRLIGAHILISITGILVYNLFFPSYTHEWFLQVLFPSFLIILGLFLSTLYRFKSLIPIIWLSLLVYLWGSIQVILNAKNSYSFGYKSQAVKWAIEQVKPEPFSLDSPSTSFSYGGYRYLFYLYGHQPVKSYMDPVFADWMYPKESIAKEHPDTVVVLLSPDFYHDPKFESTYQKYLAKTKVRKSFGRIEVLIVDNRDKWVDW